MADVSGDIPQYIGAMTVNNWKVWKLRFIADVSSLIISDLWPQ